MPYISDDSHLREYRQALEDFIDQKITPIDPTFRLTQKIKPINFREIQSLLNVETALIEWYITNEKILAFIITSQELNPIVFQSSAEDYESLINLANDYLNNYSQDKRQWRDHLPSYLQRLSDLLHLNQILTYIPSVCSQLIFVPHRILHLFPLHALPVNSDRN